MLKKYGLGFFAVVLVLIAAGMIYVKLHPKTLPEGLVQGTGRIDGNLINLASQYPGKVVRTEAEDGKAVKKGETITVLQSREYEAQLEGVRAQVAAQKAQLHARQIDLAVAKKTIPLAVTKAEAALHAREAQLRELEQGLNARRSVAAQSEKDYRRIASLFEKKLIDAHALEQAKLKRDTDRDRLRSLEHKKTQTEAAVKAARSDLKEAQASQRKLEALAADVEALRYSVTALEAQRKRLEVVIDELTLRSPVDGFVVEKITEPGEVVAPGMPVATLIDPKTLYLKIYIDTVENGKIKIGDEAEIFLDAAPDHPIPATVVRVAQKAEFTPKEVSVRSDRIQRVFAVHLMPKRPDPLLKLGLPAIGVVSGDGAPLPASLDALPAL